MSDTPQVPLADLAELDHERRMAQMGRARSALAVEKSVKGDRRASSRSGNALLRASVRELLKGMRKWRAEIRRKSRRGHRAPTADLFDQVPIAAVAVLAARAVIDRLGAPCPLIRVASAVGTLLEEEAERRAVKGASPGSLWKDLSTTLKRKRRRGTGRKIVRTVAGQLGVPVVAWEKRERLRLGLLLVELVRVHTGLIAIRNEPHGSRRRPVAMVVPTPKAADWLERADLRHGALNPVFLPTLSPPADWTNPHDGGYLTDELARRPVLKCRDRAQLDALESARPSPVYRALNTIQRVPWAVNPFVLAVARRLQEAGDPELGLEPDERRGGTPPPPYPTCHERAVKQRDCPACATFLRARADWRRKRNVSRGARIQTARTLAVADMLLGKPFYYPQQVDFRGRVYPTPSFLQPQGDSLARGLLRFAEGKALRDREHAQWMRVAGANAWGLSKSSFPDRVLWVAKNHERVLAVAADPFTYRQWVEADSPWEFLAWCDEYANWSKDPAGFVSHLPVPMDCTNSGLQLFSLLMRDPVGAEATNCVPTDAPRDIYKDVADKVTAALEGSSDPRAARWLEFVDGRVTRAFTKRAVMVLPYSGTAHSCTNYIRDAYEAHRLQRGGTPFEALEGGGYRACTYLSDLVRDAIVETLGPAQACMSWLRAVAHAATEAGVPLRWTSPSGFPVLQKYTRFTSERIQTCMGDTVRFTRFREDSDTLARGRQANGVVPNLIHSIDAAILVRAVNRARESGVKNISTVHDSFATLAADAPLFARSLRGAVADTMRTDWLGRFRDEIQATMPEGVELPPVPELGELDCESVRGALYYCS